MPADNARDPRFALVREKYFSLRPKPLERWLWQQGLPQAAERVFWLHWEEGMKRGDWCSELSLRQVARECCINTSTVTRAYQLLRNLALLQRQDPGRDPKNPFQQAIAVTEVRLPRDLVVQLGRAPNRPTRHQTDAKAPLAATGHSKDSQPRPAKPDQEASPVMKTPAPRLTRTESATLTQKLSAAERAAFFEASRDRRLQMPFDPGSALTSHEQGRVLLLLGEISGKNAEETMRPAVDYALTKPFAQPRKVSPPEAARVRKSILEEVPASVGAEVFNQVLWSMEEGALRRFDSRLAANIALKKIREGAWTRPNRMPPNWLRPAVPEACSGA